MEIKALLDEDFINYRKCSMFIGFPNCNWKCGKEFCQNSALACAPVKTVFADDLVIRYTQNPLSEAIVVGGLEPFDDFDMLYLLVKTFRESGVDDFFVIYTGYDEEEVLEEISKLSKFPNIIVKFGRFVPDQEPHFDDVLGVNLVSDNQYAEVIS